MATLPFHLLDVFTTGAVMTGNQLLVVEDRDDTLTDDSMLAIAKEIGFAESAFVRSANVRIFTTDEEVPQAGHPVLGLAEIVGQGVETGGAVQLNTKKGPITVRCDGDGVWTASQDPAEWAAALSYAEVASRLKTSPKVLVEDLNGKDPSFPVGSTCGLKYALVPVSSEEQLEALLVDPSAAPMPDPTVWLYFFYRVSVDQVRTRMFCYEGGGWIEDVATGSAAGPLAAHLAPITARFTQGHQRLAHLHVRATACHGARVEVGGAVARVAEGRWRVPAQP